MGMRIALPKGSGALPFVATVDLNGDPEQWRDAYWAIKSGGGPIVGGPESWMLGTARPFYMGDKNKFLETLKGRTSDVS
jgi:hypothetical protein